MYNGPPELNMPFDFRLTLLLFVHTQQGPAQIIDH